MLIFVGYPAGRRSCASEHANKMEFFKQVSEAASSIINESASDVGSDEPRIADVEIPPEMKSETARLKTYDKMPRL